MPGAVTRVGDTATTFDPCNVTGTTVIAGPGAVGLTGVITTASTNVFAGTIVAGPPIP